MKPMAPVDGDAVHRFVHLIRLWSEHLAASLRLRFAHTSDHLEEKQTCLTNCHGKFVLTSTARGSAILAHFQIVEDGPCIQKQLAHFLRNTFDLFVFNESHSKASESCQIFRSCPSSHPASVFIIIPIYYIVTTVLYHPVPRFIWRTFVASAWLGLKLVTP